MSNSGQSRIGGALYLVAAQGVVLVFGYATHLWIGRVLGIAPYGIYGVVLSLQSIVGLLLTLGVPVAVSHYVSRDDESAKSILGEALRIQTIIALLVSGATLLASTPLAHVLGDDSLAAYIRFSAVIIFLQAYYPVYVQYLSGMHRFSKQAALTVVYAIAKLAGALSLIYLFEVYGAFAGFGIGGIVAGVIGFFWTQRIGGKKRRVMPYRAFLSFAGTYVLILVGLQILISLDLFMVKALLHDDNAAGYYNAAVTLSRISYMLLQAISFIILPSVSALTTPGRSHTEATHFIGDTIRYLIALIVPSVALAATTSQALIRLFFSAQYLPAAPVLTVLMVGLGSIAFYLLLTNIVAGAGRAKTGLYVTAALLVMSGTLGYVLIPRFGLMGAAWQTTLTGLVGLAVLGLYTFRTFHIPFPVRSTLHVFIATAFAVLPTYLWQANPLTVFFQYLLAGVLYLGTLWVVGEIKTADRRRLAQAHPLLRWVE